MLIFHLLALEENNIFMMAIFIENSSLLNILVTIEFNKSNNFNHIFTALLIVIISCANHGVMRE